jgi:hypothetical protein
MSSSVKRLELKDNTDWPLFLSIHCSSFGFLCLGGDESMLQTNESEQVNFFLFSFSFHFGKWLIISPLLIQY